MSPGRAALGAGAQRGRPVARVAERSVKDQAAGRAADGAGCLPRLRLRRGRGEERHQTDRAQRGGGVGAPLR